MKKFHAIVFLLICSLASLSAESVKHYTNKAKGYDGWVTVEVIGNTAEAEVEGHEELFFSYLKDKRMAAQLPFFCKHLYKM